MTHDPADDLTGRLQRAAASLAPAPGAASMVHAGLGRRRRRRAVLVVGGAAAAVALVATGVAALPGGPGPDRPAPVSPATPSDAAPEQPDAFTCPTGLGHLQDPPPHPDLEGQRRTVQDLATLSSVWVRHAAPTALGVVALVGDDSGDQDYRADPAVVSRLAAMGVAHTYEWDPTAAGSGLDAGGQVRQVLGWLLDPALREVRRATRGVPGDAGLALWPDAGAIVVQWKAPVPAAVQDLAGTRPDGVRVEVRAVTYARADVRRAQRRLQSWLRETGRRDQWSSSYGCADSSGLVVGMLPGVADEPGLAEEIAAAVGMPVRVLPEERPADLTG